MKIEYHLKLILKEMKTEKFTQEELEFMLAFFTKAKEATEKILARIK